MKTITITLPDSRTSREVLDYLRDESRSERDWCEEHGRSTRAEMFERFAVAVDEALTSPPVATEETGA